MTTYQLFEALPAHIEDALRASIERFGVLVPVVRDQHGKTIDGHHRARLADDLGVKYRIDVVAVSNEDEAREIARTLNADRRQLTEEQRREIVVQLRRDGHSERAIAGALGVSKTTVHNDIESERLVSGDQSLEPERVTRQGGGSYPSKRPAKPPITAEEIEELKPENLPRRPTIVAAKNEREAERAQEALSSLGEDTSAGRVYDVKRLERVAREKEADRRRTEPVEAVSTADDVEIRHGDLRDCLADIPDGSVDAIITDPPYPKEYWDLCGDLGELARRVLTPDGVLAVMTGTRLEMVDTVDMLIGRHMRRRHRGVYLTPGQRWRDNLERVATGWKPILIYAHPDATDLPWLNDDVFTSTGTNEADQRFHHWGQNEQGFAQLIERLTDPGHLVVDPFLGGGTTAVVCRGLGRRFIGCDVDAAAVSTSRERVA